MKRLNRFTACLLLAFPALALAHGDDKHVKPSTRAASNDIHAWGRQGDPKQAVRTIAVDMADTMRFSPDTITVKQGDTVTFVVSNSGKQMHEMVIGTEDELRKHAELMKKHPGMEHEEPYMAHVAAGKKESLTWRFTQPGTFTYGCLIPGHWEAGMKGTIVVQPSLVAGVSTTARAAAAPAAATTEGEVRKVDKDAKKITLRHGEIANLGMPPMTMVFVARDPAMLEQVKAGDKVRFTAEKVGGAFTITAIEVAK